MLGEVFVSDSDCEIVKPQSSRNRRAFHMESKEDVNVAISAEDVHTVVKKEDTRSGL